MKQLKTLFAMGVFMMFLTVSQIYCQDFTQIELMDKSYYNPVTNQGKIELDPFSVTLPGNREEHTVYLSVPLDMEILDVYMQLLPVEGKIPADVTISIGGELIHELPSEFTGVECSGELRGPIEEYLKSNRKEGECTVLVPLVLASQKKGTILFSEFSFIYIITAVEELESVMGPDGMPKLFLWKPGAGPNPRFDLQIRSKELLSDSTEILLEQPNIVNAFYKLTENDMSNLRLKLEPGEMYYWGVRVKYDFGESRWTTGEFTLRPSPVRSIEERYVDDNTIEFYWDQVNAKYYEVALNGFVVASELEQNFYSINKADEVHQRYLYLDRWNILKVWALSSGEKSEPAEIVFSFQVNKLDSPGGLIPNYTKPVDRNVFSFSWESVPWAHMYEIRLFASGSPIKLPTEDGWKETVIVYSSVYDPWDEKFGDYRGLQLKSGRIYRWQVRALPYPYSEDLPMESDWAAETFVFRPVLLSTFILISAVGGLLGGFIRIAGAEQKKAKKENQKLKISLDVQKSIDLLFGLIVGVVLFLLVNQVLGQQLDPLGIPPYSYSGSLLVGFLGGMVSYNLSRLGR